MRGKPVKRSELALTREEACRWPFRPASGNWAGYHGTIGAQDVGGSAAVGETLPTADHADGADSEEELNLRSMLATSSCCRASPQAEDYPGLLNIGVTVAICGSIRPS